MLTGLLGFLGFTVSSCDPNTDEYGSPYADYSIKGKVTDTENQPIEGIQVTVTDSSYYEPVTDTLRTDAAGDFLYDRRGLGRVASVKAEDVDGEKNGAFQSDSVTVTFSNDDYKGGDNNWYKGKAEKRADMQLKKD